MSIFEISAGISVFELLLLSLVSCLHIDKRQSNIFFAVFFIAQAISSLNMLLYFHQDFIFSSFPYLLNIGNVAWFIWAPALFLAINIEIVENKKISFKLLLHFLPALIFAIILIFTFHIKTIDQKKQMLESYRFWTYQYYWWISKAVIAHVLIYNVLTIYKLERYSKRSLQTNKRFRERLNWNKFIVYGYFAACMIYNITNILFDFMIGYDLYLNLSMVIFTLYFATILFRALSSSHFTSPDIKRKVITNKIQENVIVEGLKELMENQKMYCISDLSLNQVAETLNVKKQEVSDILNSVYKMNFYEYINRFRIEEAMNILKNGTSEKQTIMEIMFDCGFNSKSAFNTAFKKQTGQTPSAYRKEHST